MSNNTTGVVAFAFGAPQDIKPNRMISDIAWAEAHEWHREWYLNEGNRPVYTQADVWVCGEDDGIDVTRVSEQAGNPPPTLRIARGAVQWALQRNLEKLVVVAAPPHMWRAVRDLRRAADEAGADIYVVASPLLRQQPYAEEYMWYCASSLQKRTRTKREWQKRDIILKLMPFLFYKRVAS